MIIYYRTLIALFALCAASDFVSQFGIFPMPAAGDSSTLQPMADRTRLGLVAAEPATAALRRRVLALQRALDRRLRRLARLIDERSVHESRIAARRLRVVLRSFAPVLEPAIARPYRHAIGEITDALEAVRDADVAVRQYDGLVDGAAQASPSSRARLVERRARARASLRAAMRGDPWHHRSSAMRLAAASPALVIPSADLAGTLADRILARRRRRTRRALRALRDPRHHPRAAHRLRLEIKGLRYLAEECRTGRSGASTREIDRLHELQDVLGDLRDVAALRKDLDTKALRRLGERRMRILGRRFKRSRRALLEAWRRQ